MVLGASATARKDIIVEGNKRKSCLKRKEKRKEGKKEEGKTDKVNRRLYKGGEPKGWRYLRMYYKFYGSEETKIHAVENSMMRFTEKSTIVSARPGPIIPGIDLVQEINIWKGVIQKKLDSNFCCIPLFHETWMY